MIHPEIKIKIARIQNYLTKVSVYKDIPTDQLLANEEKLAAMERWFLLMVDEAIDINAALMYQLGGTIAEVSKSTFFELVQLGVLQQDFAEQIAGSVKVRNELIHSYEKSQKSVTVAAMKKFIDMYTTYTKILIQKFVENK
jgi:uncharacterized protein YutE (UPF0331/DUF86 family)